MKRPVEIFKSDHKPSFFTQAQSSTALIKNETSRYRNSARGRSIVGGPIRWMLMLMFADMAYATLSLAFNHNGTDYAVTTEIDHHGEGPYSGQLQYILPDIQDKLASGICGNITLLNTTLTSLIGLWNKEICENQFEFSRAADGLGQFVFENCSIDNVLNLIATAQNKACDDAFIELMVVISFFAVAVLSTTFTIYMLCRKGNVIETSHSQVLEARSDLLALPHRNFVTDNSINSGGDDEESRPLLPKSPGGS